MLYALLNCFCRHASLFEEIGGEYNIPSALNAKTIREFDEALTRGVPCIPLNLNIDTAHSFTLSTSRFSFLIIAVSFGFKSVDDYYANSCSSDSIRNVRIPLLCIQA